MVRKKTNITIVIVAGNEEDIIEKALKSSTWADSIVLVAANSTDNTIKIAQKYTKDIVVHQDEYEKHFDIWRNLGLKTAQTDWIFYLDADEIISLGLKKELIKTASSSTDHAYFVLPRQNHYLGQKVRHGGTYPDYVKRFFKRSNLKKWQGSLHEEPLVNGSMGKLKNDLLHYTHRDLSSMLKKTIIWTQTEAKYLYQAKHPPVAWWRIFRMMATKAWERFIKQSAWKDGTVGIINSIFEVFNTFIIYARLFEMQNKKK